MQILGPRTSSLGTLYNSAQVLALLQAPIATETTAFERVTLGGSQGEFTHYVDLMSASVDHDTTRLVPRTLQVRIRQDAGLDWYNDQVRAWNRITSPDGGYVDFLLGTFVPVAPAREVDDAQVWRSVTMADATQILNDTEIATAFGVTANADLVATAVGIIQQAVPGAMIFSVPTSTRVPVPFTWSDGTTLIQIVNDLLKAIAYTPIWCDETSAFRIEPLGNYAQQQPDFLFDLTQPTTSQASLSNGSPMQENIDTTQGYNVVEMKGEDPRRNTIVATYENQSPYDPISTLNFRTKLEVITDSTVADLNTAYTRARFEAQYRSRMHRPFLMDTVSWPLSQHLDVYAVAMNDVDDGPTLQTYLESAWTKDLAPGGLTTHTLQRLFVI